jgi:hypothetical protein
MMLELCNFFQPKREHEVKELRDTQKPIKLSPSKVVSKDELKEACYYSTEHHKAFFGLMWCWLKAESSARIGLPVAGWKVSSLQQCPGC